MAVDGGASHQPTDRPSSATAAVVVQKGVQKKLAIKIMALVRIVCSQLRFSDQDTWKRDPRWSCVHLPAFGVGWLLVGSAVRVLYIFIRIIIANKSSHQQRAIKWGSFVW